MADALRHLVAAGLALAVCGPAPAGVPRLAVVGFEPAKDCDPRDTWIAPAVEQILAWRLQRSGLCELVPPGRARAARRELSDGESTPSWPRVLRLLGVQRQLAGTCSGPPHQARITLRWIDLESSQAPATARLGPRPVLGLLDEATRWVLARLGPDRIDAQTRKRLLAPVCRNVGSLEAFARAVLASRAGDLRATATRLDEAIQFEDRFLPAQLMLAQIQSQVPGVPRDRAVTNLRILRRVAREQNDLTTEAIVRLTQGTLYRLRGVDEPAATLLEQAARQARRVGAPYVELVALETIADLATTRARRSDTPDQRNKALTQAWRTEQQALALVQRTGDKLAELAARRRLAELLQRLSRPDDELAERRRVLELARQLGSKRHVAVAQYELGRFYLRRKQADEAMRAFEACLENVPDELKPQVRSQLAEAYADAGRYADAIGILRQVAAHLEQTGALRDRLACLERLAELQRLAGQTDNARQTLREAIDLAHALRDARESALRHKLASLEP